MIRQFWGGSMFCSHDQQCFSVLFLAAPEVTPFQKGSIRHPPVTSHRPPAKAKATMALLAFSQRSSRCARLSKANKYPMQGCS